MGSIKDRVDTLKIDRSLLGDALKRKEESIKLHQDTLRGIFEQNARKTFDGNELHRRVQETLRERYSPGQVNIALSRLEADGVLTKNIDLLYTWQHR